MKLLWNPLIPVVSSEDGTIYLNERGHRTQTKPEDRTVTLSLRQGIMPLYTPIGGSWLNTAESMQHILVGRALSGEHPQSAQQVIDWLEQPVPRWGGTSKRPPLCGQANASSVASGPKSDDL